jgi:hypothetical protein
MIHVNDGVAECFFRGVVRRTDMGPREREALLYSITGPLIAVVGDLYYSGRAYKLLEAQIRFDRTAENYNYRCNSREGGKVRNTSKHKTRSQLVNAATAITLGASLIAIDLARLSGSRIWVVPSVLGR